MSARTSERPTRRAAARRNVVDDEDEAGSDIENHPTKNEDEEDEEMDLAPAPRKSSRATKTPAASRRTTAARRQPSESVEPSQLFSPPESVVDEPVQPTRRAPAQRRSIKDARALRQSRINIKPDEDGVPPMPTPQPSLSPEPATPASPLADITQSVANEQTPRQTPVSIKKESEDISMQDEPARQSIIEPAAQAHIMKPEEDEAVEDQDPTEVGDKAADTTTIAEVKKIDPNITHLEKPMDIVIRTRALGIPQTKEPAEAKPRMTITYLVMTNFKSYAGKQTVGPFHASFSSVVGPNGSGKSNVIDSLLFVFGFRASKMRQGKISALIHNSATHPDLDFCEVQVHFQEVMDQPGGGCTVVPDSQLIITRRAFKNNSSKYYIDDKTSDFTTVTTLLKDRGIDLDHKRFLILQGEVESIAQMKPKAVGEHDDGLLEYLEDIIGTSKYKAPIEEAANETEQLNEVCMEKSGRVQHVEKEKNGLEDKKNKALAFLRDENDLASKQSALYQIYVAECGDNIEVTNEAAQQIQQQLDDELQRHKGAEDDIKRLEKEYKAALKAHETLEKSTQGLMKEMAKLDKDAVKLEERRKFISNKSKKAEKASDTAKFGVSEAQSLSKQADLDIVRLTANITELEEEMQTEERALAKIRDELKGKTQGLSDQIAVKQKQLEPWHAKINEKQSAIAVTRSELEILQERENAGAAAIEEAESKIASLEEQLSAKVEALQDCRQRKKSTEAEIHTVEKSLAQVTTQEAAIKTKLSGARQKADEARASLAASQNQGTVLTGLSRLQDSGRIDGFHGRLGNLGAIDAKYDVAISTACPALDNIVVDTVEVGQRCIDYLRKNNLGRANFILLDRLSQRDLSAIKTPENVPRLFDLVKSKDPKFLPAFYSAMYDTLVAKDLDQANRIAFGAKRWRVVTLDGQLIDKSGTMTGGGNRVAKGAMSSKVASAVSREQVAQYEEDLAGRQAEHEALLEEMTTLQAQIKDLQDQLPIIETEKSKLKLDIDSTQREITDAQARLQEAQSEQQPSSSDAQTIKALQKTMLSMEKELEKLKAETADVEQEIQSLQDKIMEIGGIRLRGQKAKVDGLKEQIDLVAETLGAAEVAKAKAEKAIAKHEQALEGAQAELSKLTKDMDKLQKETDSQSDDTSAFRKQAEEAQQSLQYQKDGLEELKSNLDQHLAELNETRGAEVGMRNKLEDNNKVLVDNQKRMKYWQEKLSKLSLQDVSEDGEEREPQVLPELSRDELEDLDKEELKAAIATLEERTSQHVELSVLAEYRRRVNEYSSRLADLNEALAARDSAKKRTDDLRRLRLEGFMEGFSIISLRLKEMYQMITMGGNAELELVDSLDPFSEGILFSVMPPKKSWKNISNLSGGEKTLSSLALVFALHHYKPTPLYVMDEIDAALDFRNVSIVAAYIKERTKNAQFIVISLRNNMFELASRLVGVYKTNNMTKSVTIENKDYIRAQ